MEKPKPAASSSSASAAGPPRHAPRAAYRRAFFRLGALALAVAIAVPLLHGCVRLSRSVALAERSEPFSQEPSGTPRVSVLVAGDSTAVGTGAADPRASIAGRIGAIYPQARIVNVAEDGARVRDVPDQIRAAAPATFALALIQAGGNDVLRFTSMEQLARDWERAIAAARQRAQVVAIMPAGNVGSAPIFFPPFSWLYSSQALQAHNVARNVARSAGASFIDLFYPRSEDPFLEQPQRYYAGDGLHPSGAGYGLWFKTLLDSGVLARALTH